MTTRTTSKRAAGRRLRGRKPPTRGRSGFEAGLMDRLDKDGVTYEYERESYRIVLGVPGAYCPECGGGAKRKPVRESRFTPDFFFRGWVVEAKGKLTARDRKRLLALRDQCFPDTEGRQLGLVLQRDNWMTRKKVRRYSDWAREHDIPCAVGYFPKEWTK